MDELCGARWSAGGFEGDAPWDGLLCVKPAGHDGWHETGICDPPVIHGRITWLVANEES